MALLLYRQGSRYQQPLRTSSEIRTRNLAVVLSVHFHVRRTKVYQLLCSCYPGGNFTALSRFVRPACVTPGVVLLVDALSCRTFCLHRPLYLYYNTPPA